jgi:hypothetical protein
MLFSLYSVSGHGHRSGSNGPSGPAFTSVTHLFFFGWVCALNTSKDRVLYPIWRSLPCGVHIASHTLARTSARPVAPNA